MGNTLNQAIFQAGSWNGAAAVTPHDTNDLPTVADALFIGSTGNLTVIFEDDSSSVTFNTIPVGIWPFKVKRVLDTGTGASNIVALRSVGG